MESVAEVSSSGLTPVRLDWRRVVNHAIALRRHELASHPAIGEAFKDVILEIPKTAHKSQHFRRQTSCDAIIRPPASKPLRKLDHVYRDADDEAQRFRQAVKAYELSDVPDYLKDSIISNAVHTPEEALKAAKAVADSHYEVKGFHGNIVKKLNRLFTDNAKVFTAWAELLPSQNEYLSFICGGLKLIFGAAARLKQIREEICGAIEEIPWVFERMSDTLQKFEAHDLRDGSKLHEHSAAIMAGTISLLHHIVFELSKKQSVLKRNLVCFLKQDRYGLKLSRAVEELHNTVERFYTTAEDYKTSAILQTRDAALETQNNVCVLTETTMLHAKQSQYLHMRAEQHVSLVGAQNAEKLYAKLSALDGKIGLLEAKHHQSQTDLMKHVQEAMLQTVVPVLLESNDRVDRRTGRVDEQRDEEARLRWRRQNRETREDMMARMCEAFDILNFDHIVVENDIRETLEDGPLLEMEAQDRAVALMTDLKLSGWLEPANSSVLFVNANCDPQESPTKYASAKLVDSIRSTSDSVNTTMSEMYCLPYFCGIHTHYRDPDAGPCGLMRSFIAQLLLAHRGHDLQILRQVQEIDSEDIASLCSVFACLVKNLGPQVMLFCIIDDLFAFESRSKYADDTVYLVDHLVDLVEMSRDGGRRAIIKLWFSSNTGSRRLRQLLDPSDTLVLPESIPMSGGLAQLDDVMSLTHRFCYDDSTRMAL